MGLRLPEGTPDFNKPLAVTLPPTTPPPTQKPIQLGAAIVCEGEGNCKDLRSEGTETQKLVTHMVDGMVAVLHDEDVGDEHKADWCHNETETAAELLQEKKDLSDKLTSDIAEGKDHIAALQSEIDDMLAKINELDK